MFTADMESGSQGNEKEMRHESNREQARAAGPAGRGSTRRKEGQSTPLIASRALDRPRAEIQEIGGSNGEFTLFVPVCFPQLGTFG
jgi:hypothetical protein